jgi:type 2 lantibiotic biosynthesis protein LanM
MVMALTFASGLSLIHKPRDVGLEEDFSRLLTWLNERGAPETLQGTRVINRQTHGWAEWIDHLPCGDTAEAHQYFQRAGAMLCLIYALEGTDFHSQNIIANGAHPVLIDVETLLSPRIIAAVDQDSAPSVLWTGFLPVWDRGKDPAVAYDISGLGGIEDQEMSAGVHKWEHINTNRMRVSRQAARTGRNQNTVILNGQALQASDYVDDVVDGFRRMCDFLIDQRTALLAVGGPLRPLAGRPVRFLFRATRVYDVLHNKLLDPRYLRDGLDRSIELDALCRPGTLLTGKPRYWPIIAAEQRAMERQDIPFFTTSSASDALTLEDGQTIHHFFEAPGFDRAVARLLALAAEDRERQIGFMRNSLSPTPSQPLPYP